MRRATLALAAALMLAACGGGGGDGELRVETNYDAAGAWRNLLSAPHSYAASGRGSDGRDYSYSLQFAPQGPSTYPRTGAAATRVDRQATLQASGFEPSVDIGALFFVGTFLLIGLTSGSSCSDVNMPFGLPGPVPIGSNAAMYSSSGYPNCGGSSDGSGATARWSIQFYSGDVYFCLDTTQRNAGGAVAFSQQTCLQISPTGGLGPKIQYTLVIPGQNFSLVARGG